MYIYRYASGQSANIGRFTIRFPVFNVRTMATDLRHSTILHRCCIKLPSSLNWSLQPSSCQVRKNKSCRRAGHICCSLHTSNCLAKRHDTRSQQRRVGSNCASEQRNCDALQHASEISWQCEKGIIAAHRHVTRVIYGGGGGGGGGRLFGRGRDVQSENKTQALLHLFRAWWRRRWRPCWPRGSPCYWAWGPCLGPSPPPTTPRLHAPAIIEFTTPFLVSGLVVQPWKGSCLIASQLFDCCHANNIHPCWNMYV